MGAKPFSAATRHLASLKRSHARLAAKVNTADGVNIATVATRAPTQPAALSPTKLTIRLLGPGDAWEMAKTLANCRSVSQWWTGHGLPMHFGKHSIRAAEGEQRERAKHQR